MHVSNYTAYEVRIKIPKDTSGDLNYEFFEKSQKKILGTLTGKTREELINTCKQIAEAI